ncbi:hypothetical protein ACFZDJ_50075 [Streptomyces sp. NPDC007896]|uniref:GAF domain-containing protein n=1 Tax=Streptomyces sp. NPDC007896 TaxID=3364784 RepID=UPI0036E431ED
MLVPLCARGTTLGVAQFFRHHKPDAYGDEDLLLAQEIAARAAVAIDNARRYTHARTTALTLQHSLLPRRTPVQSAVEVAGRYLPAATQLGVDGDWYDVIPLSPNPRGTSEPPAYTPYTIPSPSAAPSPARATCCPPW